MPRLPSDAEAQDDELDDLPPIDGDGGEETQSTRDLEDLDDDDDVDSDPSLDDSTGESDPVDETELDGDERETGWLGEPSETADLDLGDPLADAGSLDAALLGADGEEERIPLEDAEEPSIADDDFGVGEGGEALTLDFAEEGPVDPDEDLRDEDLPALDADDAGEDDAKPEDEAMLDDRIAGDDPLGLPWAAEPWNRVGPPLGLSTEGLAGGVSSLACVPRGALVAGRSETGRWLLLRVDLEGGRHVLAGGGLNGSRIHALAAEGDAVAAVIEGGRLMLSRDGGDSFEPVTVPEGVVAADVVVASGILWVRTRTGSLLAARPGKILERRAVPGTVVAVTGDGDGGVFGVSVDESGRPATLVRGKGELVCEAVQGPAGRPVPLVSARGDHVAYAASSPRGGVVLRGKDGTWRRFSWEGKVTALAFLDEEATLLVASYSETDDTTGLVRVDAAGHTAIVARLGAARDDADADGRAVAIACDEPRGVVWVAGGFGVAVFAKR
jgi:hypothetical protein